MRFLAVVLLGCSASASAPARPGPGSAIAGSVQLAALSDAEATKYCEDMKARGDLRLSKSDADKMMCLSIGLMAVPAANPATDAAAQAICKTAYDTCIANPPPQDPIDCSTMAAAARLPICKDVTVGEMTACLTEMVGTTAAVAAGDWCAKVESDNTLVVIDTMLRQATAGPRCRGPAGRCLGNPGTQAPP